MNDNVADQKCAYAQVGLRLCCSHTPNLAVEAHFCILLLYQGSSLRSSTPIAWERPATLASDTPRPLYGQKTPKKLVGFKVSFQTVHWTRIGHASVTVGVCFYLVERSRSARRKEPRRACSEQTNRNKPL